MEPIHKPTLLLDKERAIQNIKKMATHAAVSGVRFRPHFKTHQAAIIGDWFRAEGVKAITVSSVGMARYFADHGWQDITIAFPVNILEIEAINQLAAEINLGLLVEAEETVGFLARHLTHPVEAWIKVDIGYNRTGIRWSNFDQLGALAGQIQAARHLSLRGVLTHAGQTYGARSRREIGAIYKEMVTRLQIIREKCVTVGLGQIELSVGDTPSCSVVDDLSDVDEIRPGNFVFYDVMQLQIGSCREDEIAVGLACPVVAKHARTNKLVIYGGAVHLSKEFILDDKERPIFGYVALPDPSDQSDKSDEKGWGRHLVKTYVSSLSQEHGLIHTNSVTMGRVNIGDLVIILPVHSCLTANLMRRYQTLEGQIIPTGDFL